MNPCDNCPNKLIFMPECLDCPHFWFEEEDYETDETNT